MKKYLFLAVSLSALLFSCGPDGPDGEGGGTQPERWAEGIYEPGNKINTVAYDGVPEEQWSWAGNRLDHISYVYGSMITFGYSGDYLSSVSSEEDGTTMEIRYFYNGGLLSNYDIYYDNMLAVSARVNRNAGNKISSAVYTVSDEYLNLIMGGITDMKSLSNMVGENMAESLLRMARMKALNSSKVELTNTTIAASYKWEGDNVVEESTLADINMTLSAEEMAMMESMFGVDIPDAILALLGSTGLPLKMTMTDTMSYAYDDKKNPYCYCWTEGVSAATLSRNNPVSVNERSMESVSLSAMGQVIPLMEEPYESNDVYAYTYNEAGFPTRVVSGDGSVMTITYK